MSTNPNCSTSNQKVELIEQRKLVPAKIKRHSISTWHTKVTYPFLFTEKIIIKKKKKHHYKEEERPRTLVEHLCMY